MRTGRRSKPCALGLDFLFATDHASDSGQTTNIEPIYVDNVDLPSPFGFLDGLVDALVDGTVIGAQTEMNAARDMNPHRFAAMRAWLNGANGANAEVMQMPGRTSAPRIFLGGEVDVIPEMSAAEGASGLLMYGDGRGYDWRSACDDVPDQIKQLEEWTNAAVCKSPSDLAEPRPDPNRFSVKDAQGLAQLFYARQHFVHLPTDGTRDDAFVSSRTSLFGGATRHLDNVLHDEYDVGHKGYVFLAHPAAASSGSGAGRLGPDMIPYSDIQLRTAFESQSMLGLQLWNEDTRLRGGGPYTGFPIQGQDLPYGYSMWRWGHWDGAAPDDAYGLLHDGLASWDKMLVWGIRPSQTASLAWLPPGQPRRVFMAGGSDAHGDWNYRREGSISGLSGAVDTAIGKPRNLVHVGASRPETVPGADGGEYGTVGQAQVTAALATGEFSVTDGPVLRIAADVNGNGVIDAGDVPMGGLTSYAAEGASMPFVVEWKSTDEFGPVAGIDLYVGVTNDATDEALIYAPLGHGIHTRYTMSATPSLHPYIDSAGTAHTRMWDGYMVDPTGRLHVTPSAGEEMSGRRTVYLRLNDYVVGTPREQPGDETCHLNQYCHKPGFEDLCDEVCTEGDPTYVFDNVSRPNRMFVRAFARTAPKADASLCAPSPTPSFAQQDAQLYGRCIERLAFTNPVWATNYVAGAPPPPPKPIAIGKACNGSVPCVCNAYCATSAACTGTKCPPTSGVCTAAAPLGAACSATTPCVEAAYCSRNVCAPRAAEGEACSASRPCVPTATCSSSGTCQPKLTPVGICK